MIDCEKDCPRRDLIDKQMNFFIGDARDHAIQNTCFHCQKTQLQKAELALNHAAEFAAERAGDCPLGVYEWDDDCIKKCSDPKTTVAQCWLEYFQWKAEGVK